jgi:hypothetical protein
MILCDRRKRDTGLKHSEGATERGRGMQTTIRGYIKTTENERQKREIVKER